MLKWQINSGDNLIFGGAEYETGFVQLPSTHLESQPL